MKNVILLLILLLVLIISPLNRALKIQNQPEHINDDKSTQYADKVAGLAYLGRRAATNQGPYFITGYKHMKCQGSIALLPLHRNAEGEHILRKVLESNQLRHGILFQGRIYREFPQYAYAFEKFLRNVKIHLGIKADRKIQAVAFAEKGGCNLAETLASHFL